MTRILLFAIAALVAHPLETPAQGLASVAKEEEARRKTVKQPGKVYTNTELRKDITEPRPPPPAAAGPAAPAAPGTQVPQVNLAAGNAEAKEPRDEKYWRGRIASARATVERSRVLADALQSRLNALATDIVNRDDPAQRSQLELERSRALSELERMKKEIVDQSKDILDIEEEARRANVPPGWLRN